MDAFPAGDPWLLPLPLRDHGEDAVDAVMRAVPGDGRGLSAATGISLPNSDTDGECMGTCTCRRAPSASNVFRTTCWGIREGPRDGSAGIGGGLVGASESHEVVMNAEGCIVWVAGRMGAARDAGFSAGLGGLPDTEVMGRAARPLLDSGDATGGELSDPAEPTDTAKALTARFVSAGTALGADGFEGYLGGAGDARR